MQKHLLLIDDDEDEYDIFTSMLEELPPMRFSYANNGHKGLEAMKSLKPDMVLLDMNMPAMNGLECLKCIMDDPGLRSIPVYLFSNSNSMQLMQEAVENGATAYIRKPSDYKKLKEVVSEVLEHNGFTG